MVLTNVFFWNLIKYLTQCAFTTCSVTLTIRKLEHEILAAGHHVCVLTTRSGNAAHTDAVGSHPNRQVIFMDNAYPIPFLHDPKRPELTYQIGLDISSSVLKKLDDFAPTIVHITVPDCTTLHIIQYARRKEIPIVATYHSNIPEYMEHYPGLSFMKHIVAAFFRHQYNFVQALYVPTPFIVKHLIDSYKMDACTKLEVWGRGVDVSQFSPSHRCMKFRRSLGIADNVCVLLWVGRLVPEKRPDIFASVVRRLHDQGLNFHALVVGIGPCERDICDLPNTSFLGWMSGEQLSTAYASSDVFLFPSAVETFGNVTLEAAASGLPVVVEAGCSGHLVIEGKNGYKIEEGDTESFFEATLSLVLDSKRRESFGSCSRELALTLEKSSVVRQMLNNYSNITDEFYINYGGHHFNRDISYTKPESFQFGRYPRPILWFVVERLFMVLFRVMWNMSVMFTMLLDSVSRRNNKVKAENHFTMSTTSPPMSPLRSTSSKDGLEVQLPMGNEKTKRPIIDMKDIEIGQVSSISDLQKEDDGTSTTKSSQDDQISAQSATRVPAVGDWQISHTAAIAFIKTLQYQCRLESYCRSIYNKRSSQIIQGIYPARKNSNDFVSCAEDDIESVHGRSRFADVNVNELFNVVDISQPPPSYGLQDARVMRRNQILSESVHAI